MANSQKFIARNRAPRVQIEYDVELYGAEKKVQLPFVMGVMSDLSGKSEEPLPAVADRKFLEIDVDNFDSRMKSMKPRAAFTVPNTLTGEGNMAVDITFESMDDFSPAAIARKVEPLRALLDARTHLANLTTYMDGKTGAEALIEQTLQNPALLSALAETPRDQANFAALESLRAMQPVEQEDPDTKGAALNALRATKIEPAETPDTKAAALDALRAATPVTEAAPDTKGAALDALRATKVEAEETPDTTSAALDALRATKVEPAETPDTKAAALEALRATTPVTEAAPDTKGAALDALRATKVEAEEAPDTTSAALDALRATKVDPAEAPDTKAAALDALRAATPITEAAPDTKGAALDALRATKVETEEAQDTTSAALEALRATTPVTEAAPDTKGAALDALRATKVEAEEAPDTTSAALDALRATKVEPAEAPDTKAAALDALRASAPEPDDETTLPPMALRAGLGGAPSHTKPTTPLATDPDDEVTLPPRPLAPVAAKDLELEDPLAALLADAVASEEEKPASLSELLDSSEDDDPLADLLADAAPVQEAEDDLDLSASLGDLLEDNADADPLADLLADAMDSDDTLDFDDGPGAVTDDATTQALTTAVDLPQDLDADDAPLITNHDHAEQDQTDADTTIRDDLDDLLGDLDLSEAPVESSEESQVPLPAQADDLDDLDALLGDMDRDLAAEEATAESQESQADLLADLGAAETSELDDLDDLLGGLDAPEAEDNSLDAPVGTVSEPEVIVSQAGAASDLDDLLGALDSTAPETAAMNDLEELTADLETEADDLDDLLGALDSTPPEAAAMNDLAALPTDSGTEADDLDDLLGALDSTPPEAAAMNDLEALPTDSDTEADDLDELLSDLGAGDADPLAGLDDLLGSPPTPLAEDDDPLAGLDDLLAEGFPSPPDPLDEDPLAGLDDLLASLDEPPPPAPAAAEDDWMSELDTLLANVGPETATAEDPLADLDDLLASLDDETKAEDQEPSSAVEQEAAPVGKQTDADHPFGYIAAPKPSSEALNRPKFRMALFGDFSGRAARGLMEIGDKLAARRAIELDIDTVEEVIEGFATTLVLPIGPDGRGIEVKLTELDDMHPDELVDNLEIFGALKALRARLANASTAASAVREMQGWGETFQTPVAATHAQSAGASIPANKRLSDFQKLIGDSTGRLTQISPVDDMIAQIIGPYVVPGPNAQAAALIETVDEALGNAMRLVLHHPEFQTLEAQWRSLDLLARRVETDVKLTITVFDVSAEELAADLSQHQDLSQSGLFKLLNAPLQDEGGIGFSALYGLYTFEETPPHAELLARLAQVAAHVQAPFLTALTPGFMAIDMKDRHPLVAAAWDELRDLAAASYLGLATPRFLMRRPYGAKSDPIDAFEFEEFTDHEGLAGMLWANPVVAVAVLMAKAWKDNGPRMNLGSVMSLDDIPFHYATDKHGDQVALPCTERNLTESKVQRCIERGLIPLVSIRGRDVVRLGSYQSLGGDTIAGPWSGPPAPRNPKSRGPGLNVAMDIPKKPAASGAPASAAVTDDLDALLAGFGDSAAPTDPDAMDAELAALLEGL